MTTGTPKRPIILGVPEVNTLCRNAYEGRLMAHPMLLALARGESIVIDGVYYAATPGARRLAVAYRNETLPN